MTDKPKCKECDERDVFSKELCTRCYGRKWRQEQKAKREGVILALEAGTPTDDTALVVIDAIPPTHLVATNPVEMKAAQGDLKAWLEAKLDVLERDIKDANAALTEARQNGWNTSALTSARNRAVDDETFYHKILMAVEAGHTMIPDFPIDVFAVRRGEKEKPERNTFNGVTNGRSTYLGHAAQPDCAPAGAGEFRNPEAHTMQTVMENRAPGAQERGEPRYYTTVERTGYPAHDINFPKTAARAPIMKATADAMREKVFDQIGICFPIAPATATGASQRQIQPNATRAGDPLIIGQVVRKRVGARQKVASFLIAWHLNLNDL